jgi:hypothetical protein
MRERAIQIGGALNLWSEPGSGTEVELCVPGAVAYSAAGNDRQRFGLIRRQRGMP